MKVLAVSSTFPQFEGDPRGEFVLRHWERRAAAGDQVRVLAPRTAWCAGELSTPCTVRRFRYAPRRASTLSGRFGILENLRESPRRALLLPGFQLGLERALADELDRGPDLVAAHMFLPCGLAVARQCVARGVPFVVYGHGTDVDLLLALPAPLRGWIARRFALAKWIHFPSREKLERYRRAFGPQPNLAVERMLASVAPAPLAPEGPRSGILSLGRLIRQKGVDDLLRAAATLTPSPVVHVAGEGPERASLEALARDLGLDARFHGYVRGAAKERLLREAAVLCVASRELRGGLSEGSPLVIVEAQRRGLPVVATRVGGIPELCPPGSGAVLVPAGDRAALARALHDALSPAPVTPSGARDTDPVCELASKGTP